MSTLPSLVDAFVQKVNDQSRPPEFVGDVPQFLRRRVAEDSPHANDTDCTDWHIVRRDNARLIDEIETQTGMPFPESFRYFLANYSFPAFEFGPILFFANTGEHTHWELPERLFADPHMSPYLLKAGFLQFGNPFFYNYDPVCFDINSEGFEKRIVQLDHEAILMDTQTVVVADVAPSFIDFMQAALR